MLQAPTSEAKTESAQSKSHLAAQPELELHPHAFGAVGTYSFPGAARVVTACSSEEPNRHPLTGMQSTYGNQAVLRLLHSPQQVAAMPALRPSQSMMLQRKCACGGSSELEEECAECKAKREGALQRSVGHQGVSPIANTVPPIVHDVLSSPGQPLDAGTRAFMEPRFRHDFSQVRVHTDARAIESAQAVNALAYTVGRNVVFGAGQCAPGTDEGRRLMAHELTHVVQQKDAYGIYSKRTVNPINDPNEQNADRVAEQILNQRTVQSSALTVSTKQGIELQRKEAAEAEELPQEERQPIPLKQVIKPEGPATALPDCTYPTSVELVKPYDVELSPLGTNGQICAHMRVKLVQKLCVSAVGEHLTLKSGASCPETLNLDEKGEKRPLCGRETESFPLGGVGRRCEGVRSVVKIGPTDFVDDHNFQWMGSVLHDHDRNPEGLNQCFYICSQYYYFKDSRGQEKRLKGNFEIRFDFKRTKTKQGNEATDVKVSKKAV